MKKLFLSLYLVLIAHLDVLRAQDCPLVPLLPPFMDPLPIPRVAKPARTNANYRVPVATNLVYANVPEYDMPMKPLMHQFHASMPPVEVWGYDGSYPGPTFETEVDHPILVNWINQLPERYPSWLPIDLTFHGVPDDTVRTVVHLHGGTTLPRYDGHPENWFRTGQFDQYFYGNIDPDGDGQTLWYHDHAVGTTGANVYAGLAGFYLLRNRALEESLKLPSGEYEIPLVFQDREFQTNCAPASLYFGPAPWGKHAVVNGKITPYLEVEPRRYRFRVLNGSNFRTYGLSLLLTDLAGKATGNTNPPSFHMIGTEDGFLKKTVDIAGTLMVPLMGGERADFIIDFSKYSGSASNTITMINKIGNGDVPNETKITNLMQFRVILPLKNPDTSVTPVDINTNLPALASLMAKSIRTREFTLDMWNESPAPGSPFSTNNHPNALINMKYFHDKVTEQPHAGDTEIWTVINLSLEAHPFHIHLTDFRVIDRLRFAGWDGVQTNPPTAVTNYINDRKNGVLKDISTYMEIVTNEETYFPVRQFEDGPKDVVRAAPFAMTRFVVTFPTNSFYFETPALINGDPESAGMYVYHCHILDHEDNDMMRPYQLLSIYQPRMVASPLASVNPSGFNHFNLRFSSRTNESYQIQTTTDLDKFIWTALPGDPVPGTGSSITVTPPSATDPSRLYRLLRIP